MPGIDRAVRAKAGYFLTLSNPSGVIPYEFAFRTSSPVQYFIENVQARIDSTDFEVVLYEGVSAPTGGTSVPFKNFNRAGEDGHELVHGVGITTGGVEVTGRGYSAKNNENVDLDQQGRPTPLLLAETWYSVRFTGTSGAVNRFTLQLLGDV